MYSEMDTWVFCNKSLFLKRECDGIETTSIVPEIQLRTVVGLSPCVKCICAYTYHLIIESYSNRTANENSTDEATKDTESVSTEVTYSHNIKNLADPMNQLPSGVTSTDDIEQNRIVPKSSPNVSCEKRKFLIIN